MRIAIPVTTDDTLAPLGSAAAFHFYEDDHGKVVRQFLVPAEQPGLDAAIALLERYGIDSLVCDAVSEDERREVAMAGIMLFPSAAARADDAALAFLSGTVAFDPTNTCNACGHGHACSLSCKSCQLKH